MGDLAKTLLSKYVAPFKTYFYIVGAIAAVAYWEIHNYHERQIGKKELAAQVQATADAKIIHTKEVEARANTLAGDLEAAYEKARITPSTNHRTARLCVDQVRVDPVPSAVPGTGGDNGPSDSGAGHNLTAGPDIGDALINIGKHANDQIKALQQRVRDLEKEMNDANTPSR